MSRPSLTIGISAFNEEKNIKKLLVSLLTQKIRSAELVKILIFDDGSSDNTYKEISSFSSDKIQCVHDGENLGKSERLNQIFKTADADVLVLIDADTIPSDNNTIENLVSKITERKYSLASGNPQKKRENNRTSKILEVSAFLQEYVRSRLNGGDNVYSCHGRLIATNRAIYKNIEIPPETVGNDAFIYFVNKTLGGKFLYVSEAKITYKMPGSLKDFSKQRNRFKHSQDMHRAHFSTKINVEKEYSIPKGLLLKAVLWSFLRNPIYTFRYFFMTFASKFYNYKPKQIGWDVSETTK